MNISSILSAVKPNKRSDIYVVLAAMYSLEAGKAPVAVKQITDLLKLHLPGKAPTNVAGCLRRHPALVEPADPGPPMKWRLLPRGVEELRKQGSLPLLTVESVQNYATDIGIVCALEQPEFAAVQEAFGGAKAWKEIGSQNYPHIYRETALLTVAQNKLRIVATTCSSMGLTAAAIATTHLLFQFRPRLVVMIGIAAGTRSGGKQFGDVLVADPSVDYMSGKVASVDGERQFLPDPYPLGLQPRIRSVLRRHIASRATLDSVRSRWNGNVPASANRLHLGPLGAADQVIDDGTRIQEIQLNWRKLIGLEMETYGVYRACHEAPEPKPEVISFKAACDFAEGKTDDWQEYAAFIAAGFAAEFLTTEWEALWPT